MKLHRLVGVLAIAGIAFLSTSCDENFDDENDIIVINGSGCSLARLTLDGIDRGPIGRAETREFDDVGDGVHHLEAYRDADDSLPCDTHTTEDLRRDEDEFWTIQCSCD